MVLEAKPFQLQNGKCLEIDLNTRCLDDVKREKITYWHSRIKLQVDPTMVTGTMLAIGQDNEGPVAAGASISANKFNIGYQQWAATDDDNQYPYFDCDHVIAVPRDQNITNVTPTYTQVMSGANEGRWEITAWTVNLYHDGMNLGTLIDIYVDLYVSTYDGSGIRFA